MSAVSVVRSLAELGEIARREEQLAMQAVANAVTHAVAAGLALIEARDQLSHGDWHKWLHANWPRTVNRANSYMRIARHRDTVFAANPPTIQAATKMLVGADDNRVDPTLKAEAARLRKEGRTWAEIAREVNRSVSAVRRWVDPRAVEHARRRSQRRTKAAQRALREKERAAIVKRAGGGIAEAYALVRRALATLDVAAAAEADEDAKKGIRSAMASLYNAEDRIAEASRTTKPRPKAAA